MFFVDLLFALVVALLLTAVFFAGFRRPGPWGIWWIFLLVVFLAAWAGGVWIEPFGPPLFNVYWLPFVFVGLIFALLVAAAAPPAPPRPYATATAPQEPVAVAVDLFFWVMVVGLLLAIIVAYI